MKCAWQLDAVLKRRKFQEVNTDTVKLCMQMSGNFTKLVNCCILKCAECTANSENRVPNIFNKLQNINCSPA